MGEYTSSEACPPKPFRVGMDKVDQRMGPTLDNVSAGTGDVLRAHTLRVQERLQREVQVRQSQPGLHSALQLWG